MKLFLTILVLSTCLCCTTATVNNEQWFLFTDTLTHTQGYKDVHNVVKISAGKYTQCYTDTFTSYAIVAIASKGLYAINQNQELLYQVYVFDNGPDYAQDGLFRIVRNNKIGYANATTGAVVIAPEFDGAYPFENGIAKVNKGCTSVTNGEHSAWLGGEWFYIDRKGEVIAPR
jgi:hypothetical protein